MKHEEQSAGFHWKGHTRDRAAAGMGLAAAHAFADAGAAVVMADARKDTVQQEA